MTEYQHRLFHQDFFYHALVSYMDLIDVVDHRLLCQLFYRVSLPTLRKWSKYWRVGGLPDRAVYQELVQWEEEQGINVPDEIKCFYASWREKVPIYQSQYTVFGSISAGKGRIRQLFLYHQEYLSRFTYDDYLCLACTSVHSVHKDWDVYLITYLDLNGKYTGQKNSIFDIEYVDHSNIEEDDFRAELFSYIDPEKIGQGTYQGHGYTSFEIGMTARNFFELLDMMPENRFYFSDAATNQPVYWIRATGRKSFLTPLEDRINLSEEVLNDPEEENEEYFKMRYSWY